jgi:hypothetical protein
MEPGDYDEIPYVTYCCLLEVGTAGGIKQMVKHNTSQNGRGSWVAFCANPTHTDTDPCDLGS